MDIEDLIVKYNGDGSIALLNKKKVITKNKDFIDLFLSQQQEIERLKGDREKLYQLSRFDFIDDDIQSAHDGEYVLLNDVEELLKLPTEPKEG